VDERELWQLRKDVTELQEWRADRDKERATFQRSWSGEDVEKLRRMLNGYIGQQAVRGFLDTTSGKLIAATVVITSWAGTALAIVNFITIHRGGGH
jgi:hypothetical protein